MYSAEKEASQSAETQAKYGTYLIGGVDQGSVAQLSTMLENNGLKGDLDFIIDDGSHHPEHQEISFKYLFDTGTYS